MSNNRNILLTGGRLWPAIEIARHLSGAGHRVIMAETVTWAASRFSRSIAKHYYLPPPRFDYDGFVRRLLHIITSEKIDFLLPCAEESFWISLAREELGHACTVFVDSIGTLAGCHNKWEFVQRARRHGLPVPETELVPTEGLLQTIPNPEDRVFKPVYSRFATSILIRPRGEDLHRIRPTPEQPWVAQEFLAGQQHCTYSVAHAGRLACHSAYTPILTAGVGPAIAFAPVRHQGMYEWVEQFVAAEQFTGQIGFDFIETSNGVMAIECNPRTTNGVYLFRGTPGFDRVFLDPDLPPLTPRSDTPVASLGEMVYHMRRLKTRSDWKRWWQVLRSSRELDSPESDPFMFLGRWSEAIGVVSLARKRQMGLRQAATYDFEWNGEIVRPRIS
jgi:hypothetical protein